jgi:hypothetical protein
MDRPDPYDKLRAAAVELEAQGHSAESIIDALFRLSVNTAVRLNGREVVSSSLYDMAALVATATKPTTH